MDEEYFEEVRKHYSKVFHESHKLGQILATQSDLRDRLFLYSAALPIYAPKENRQGWHTLFDDFPHLDQIAERHAWAFQLAPLFGNVLGYEGASVLAKDDEVVNANKPIDLQSPNLATTVRDMLDDASTTINRCFVGSPKILNPIRRSLERIQETPVGFEFIRIPRAPVDRFFVVPPRGRFATLAIPAEGEITYGDPEDQGSRFIIVARAHNRLEIHDRGKITGFRVETRNNVGG